MPKRSQRVRCSLPAGHAGISMRDQYRCHMVFAVVGILSAVCASADRNVSAPMPELARGVWLVSGGILGNREPDGNSVVFAAPAGLIVFDTGRHQSQRDAILSLARVQKMDIVAIINSHWHLDHVSGNPALRAAYPNLKVYASSAIDDALTGFLASSAKDSGKYLDDPRISEELRADIRADSLTIQKGEALKPDVVIATSGVMVVGGRALKVNLAKDAATAGDVWLYDEKDELAALGDLVTLPAPFLDTACPDGWKAALAQIASVPFRIAIPGHGPPITHSQFLLYKLAFESFIDCSRSAVAVEDCATRWADVTEPLLEPNSQMGRRAKDTANYYAGMLRASDGRSKYCQNSKRL
jgi:glyoxylase-like metal-dependent hydrolase (beta-lactamase superfamily II)